MSSFIIFQFLYIILNSLNSEKNNDNVVTYLTDANPFMRDGENSVDLVVYEDFKEKFYMFKNHDDYSYDFVCYYLKNIDYYKDLYDTFKQITREEYIDTCKAILEDKEIPLKFINCN